jgi:sarcosine oxidase subunit gamma
MHRSLSDGGSIIRVQTWDIGAAVPMAVEDLLGVPWPRETKAVVSGRSPVTVICVGPSEWLVLDGELSASALIVELNAAFAASSYRATDASQTLVRLPIAGTAACRVLGKGCSLDLDTAAFGAGCAARTRLAGIPVVVWRTGDFTFECLLTRSYGEYFRGWLDDAALEFQGAA